MLARHLLHHRETLFALASIGLRAALGRRGRGGVLPPVTRVLPPRPDALVDDHVRVTGGELGAYRDTVPPHLFPEWLFPLAAELWEQLPYDLAKVMNLGAELTVLAPLPRRTPLEATVRVTRIDDDGRRALVTQELETSAGGAPRLRATVTALLPLRGRNDDPAPKGERRPKKPLSTVPRDVEELSFERLPADLGRRFALVTGDVNPIHWIAPYARAMGHETPILHGFCSFARAFERLVRARCAGDPTRVERLEARFTRPLPLPSRVGTYVRGAELYVGDAPGGAAYLQGAFSLR